VGVYYALRPSSSSTPAYTATMPLIKPPVAAATPAALKTGSAGLSRRRRLSSLSVAHVRDRFFDPEGGPSNLFVILQSVDDRVAGINSRASTTFGECLNATATNYSIRQWVGANVTMYAQCAETIDGRTDWFDLFAVKNRTAYLYTHVGDATVAAIAERSNATVNETIGNETVRVDVW
jgi:hypothetical protein